MSELPSFPHRCSFPLPSPQSPRTLFNCTRFVPEEHRRPHLGRLSLPPRRTSSPGRAGGSCATAADETRDAGAGSDEAPCGHEPVSSAGVLLDSAYSRRVASPRHCLSSGGRCSRPPRALTTAGEGGNAGDASVAPLIGGARPDAPCPQSPLPGYCLHAVRRASKAHQVPDPSHPCRTPFWKIELQDNPMMFLVLIKKRSDASLRASQHRGII